MKALYIDFEDSFCFNVLQFLSQLKIEIISLNFSKIELQKIDFDKYDLLIIGPGPGHPDNIEIKCLLEYFKNKKTIGICLGHQILMNSMGFKIRTKVKQNHGESEMLHLFGKLINVQFYNSLAVRVEDLQKTQEMQFNNENELIAFSSSNILTYQFHPESMATSSKAYLLYSIQKFLYNDRDGKN